MQKTTRAALQLAVEGLKASCRSLSGASKWLNSKPLRAAQLRGKVVLVEFWISSRVNWRRTLPYVRAWAEKYKDRGLVVIGVHSPEFSFEKIVNNESILVFSKHPGRAQREAFDFFLHTTKSRHQNIPPLRPG